MRRTSKSGTVVSVISYILVVLAILAIIGYIVYFTNGLTTDFQSIYLKYGDTIIRQDLTGWIFPEEGARFEVRSALGTKVKYQVEVRTYTEEDGFTYLVDGQPIKYIAGQDCTAAFEICAEEESFTIRWDRDFRRVLAVLHPGREVTEVPEIGGNGKDYFILAVKAGDKELRIAFHDAVYVSGVLVTPDKVIF